MVNSISASNSQQVGSVDHSVPAPVKSTAPVAAPAGAPKQQDQVKLSLSAQILALHHQGMSANQIAANLGMPVKSVSSYLPGSTLAAPAPAAPTAAQGAPAAPPAGT